MEAAGGRQTQQRRAMDKNDVVRRDRLWRRTQWTGHRGGGESERSLPIGNKQSREDDDQIVFTGDD